jgi:rieske iron-sulfur protein
MSIAGPSSPAGVGAEAVDGCSGPKPDRPPSRGPARRAVLIAGLAAAGLPFAENAAAQKAAVPPPPQNARPQEGDRFVFVSGDRQGAEIRPDDLPAGGPSVLAWPVDRKTETMRDGSRLNQVLLVRLDPASLDDETRSRAAEGIVAYSATCSHAQCPVTGWGPEKKVFHCACHQSEYDPSRGARVVSGPAPRPLPALPLRIEDGALVAAGTFIGRVGNRPG